VYFSTDTSDDGGSWTLFTGIVIDMRSLKLLHFFMDSAVKSVLYDKVIHCMVRGHNL